MLGMINQEKECQKQGEQVIISEFFIEQKNLYEKGEGRRGEKKKEEEKNIHAYHLLYNSPTTQLRCNLFSNPLK